MTREHAPGPAPDHQAGGRRAAAARPVALRRAAARWLLAWAAGLAALLGPAGDRAAAQTENPVFADDSPAAASTLPMLDQLVASGNQAEAVRAVQELLDTEAERVLADPDDPHLFHSVRSRVHAALLASPSLLARYRADLEPRAAAALAEGRERWAETSALLTPSGFEAALRLAQEDLESARFESARLTLAQLELHPDRAAGSPAAIDAARMASAVARYLGRADAWAWADRWCAEAGVEPAAGDDRQPPPRPPALRSRVVDTRSAGDEPGDDLPDRPLWTSPLSDEAPTPAAPLLPPGRAPALWVQPTIVGDRLLINDGISIRCLDRFTLEPVWATRPRLAPGMDADAADRFTSRPREVLAGPATEDSTSVTVAGSIVLATTGVAEHGDRAGDPRVHALDLRTGRVLWSVWLPAVDPRLEYTTIRGPVSWDGDIAIVAARKAAQAQRVIAHYLVGLDLSTGAVRWVRIVGSAGSLPYGSQRRVAETAVLDRGVVYTADQLGVMGAVEAATGRPVWVRRVPVPEGMSTTGVGPWESNAAVIAGDRVIALTPDRRTVLKLDRATGRVLARLAASELDSPAYLVAAGDSVAAVARTRLIFMPIDTFDPRAARHSESFARTGDGGAEQLRGRVTAVGDRLLAPTTNGAVLIDPDQPRPTARAIGLDRPGTLLSADGQLVVVDDTSAYSYVKWETADALLRRRIEAAPDDPGPAITAADLAFRAGRPERVAPAADLALSALRRRADSSDADAARARLFDTLHAMIASSQAAWSDPGAVGPPPLPDDEMDALLDRVADAATTPAQRVVHGMLLGSLREHQSRAADAVEAYQRVLEDPVHAAAPWSAGGIRSAAGLEAARRVRSLVLSHGFSAYAAADARARARSADLPADAGPDAIEALAAGFPCSPAVIDLWTRAGEARSRAGRQPDALADFSAALQAAETCRFSGATADNAVLAAAAGRLITALDEADRPGAALGVLDRIGEMYPGLVLTDRGRAVDAATLAAGLNTRLAARERPPRLGAQIVGSPEVLPGWRLLRPLARDGAGRASEYVVLASDRDRRIGVFSSDGGGSDPAGRGRTALSPVWTEQFDGPGPVLLRAEPSAIVLYRPSARGPVLERVEAATGRSAWRTDPFLDCFAPDPAFDQRLADGLGNAVRFSTPGEPEVRITDTIVAFDESAIAIVERSGRFVTFDARTGARLASGDGGVAAVYDAACRDGRLVLAGSARAPQQAGGIVDPDPLIVALDARSGRELRRVDTIVGDLRWVRLAQGGTLLAMTRSELIALDLEAGRERWATSNAATIDGLDGWIFGDRVFVLSEDRMIFSGTVSGGLDPLPLADQGRLSTTEPVDAALTGGGRVAFTTGAGLLLADLVTGRAVGVDALDADDTLLPAAVGDQVVALLSGEGEVLDDGRRSYDLWLISSATAAIEARHRLALLHPPTRVQAIDGLLAVTAGDATLVYPMPATRP